MKASVVRGWIEILDMWIELVGIKALALLYLLQTWLPNRDAKFNYKRNVRSHYTQQLWTNLITSIEFLSKHPTGSSFYFFPQYPSSSSNFYMDRKFKCIGLLNRLNIQTTMSMAILLAFARTQLCMLSIFFSFLFSITAHPSYHFFPLSSTKKHTFFDICTIAKKPKRQNVHRMNVYTYKEGTEHTKNKKNNCKMNIWSFPFSYVFNERNCTNIG